MGRDTNSMDRMLSLLELSFSLPHITIAIYLLFVQCNRKKIGIRRTRSCKKNYRNGRGRGGRERVRGGDIRESETERPILWRILTITSGTNGLRLWQEKWKKNKGTRAMEKKSVYLHSVLSSYTYRHVLNSVCI